ncbi:hypothetical protein D5086_003704 [Populus alba]|uniref:Uncharacterized protein n=1 Tax=Populus alba TaxID=43335 RepID=A0ACC4D6R8_POPAL
MSERVDSVSCKFQFQFPWSSMQIVFILIRCFSLSSCGPSLLLLGSFFCWIYGVLVAFASALAGIEVQIQVDDAGIAGRQFSLGVLKLVTCMALIG